LAYSIAFSGVKPSSRSIWAARSRRVWTVIIGGKLPRDGRASNRKGALA
jgi:hypothetical protein